MTKKQAFIREVVEIVQVFGVGVADKLGRIQEEYFDLGYNTGGADAVVAQDLSELQLTVEEFVAAITLLEQLGKFVGNAAVITGDRSGVINSFRRV